MSEEAAREESWCGASNSRFGVLTVDVDEAVVRL